MKKLTILFFLFALISCGKDKYNTKPTLKFKDLNSKNIRKNDDLIFRLNVTDLEGDLQDSIFVLRVTKNCSASNVNNKYKLPKFPVGKNTNVDIQVAYSYKVSGDYPVLSDPRCNKNDTCIFRFVIKDTMRNYSDTVNSPEFIIYK